MIIGRFEHCSFLIEYSTFFTYSKIDFHVRMRYMPSTQAIALLPNLYQVLRYSIPSIVSKYKWNCVVCMAIKRHWYTILYIEKRVTIGARSIMVLVPDRKRCDDCPGMVVRYTVFYNFTYYFLFRLYVGYVVWVQCQAIK